jgi:hypothetical protein
MKITTIGIDLAKEVFQIHGVDAQGNPSSQLFPPKPPKIPHFFTESKNNPFIINSDYFC